MTESSQHFIHPIRVQAMDVALQRRCAHDLRINGHTHKQVKGYKSITTRGHSYGCDMSVLTDAEIFVLLQEAHAQAYTLLSTNQGTDDGCVKMWQASGSVLEVYFCKLQTSRLLELA